MRLNLGRIQRAAENQPEHALKDACQDSCLASFKRSNSGHRGSLSFLCGLDPYVVNYLPGPILASQNQRISTISSVLVPADLSFEMKVQKV
jgi:hypothetical protein